MESKLLQRGYVETKPNQADYLITRFGQINKEVKEISFKDCYKNLGFSSLGGCPRIDIFFQIGAFRKNKHSHIFDIGVYAYLRALFFEITTSWGKRAFSNRLLVGKLSKGSSKGSITRVFSSGTLILDVVDIKTKMVNLAWYRHQHLLGLKPKQEGIA